VTGDRPQEEVAIVVRRPTVGGHEYLVVLRSPEKLGYPEPREAVRLAAAAA